MDFSRPNFQQAASAVSDLRMAETYFTIVTFPLRCVTHKISHWNTDTGCLKKRCCWRPQILTKIERRVALVSHGHDLGALDSLRNDQTNTQRQFLSSPFEIANSKGCHIYGSQRQFFLEEKKAKKVLNIFLVPETKF